MRLSDIVQHAELHLWAELALVIFIGVFLLVSIRVLRTDRTHTRSLAMTPLQDDQPIDPQKEVLRAEHH